MDRSILATGKGGGCGIIIVCLSYFLLAAAGRASEQSDYTQKTTHLGARALARLCVHRLIACWRIVQRIRCLRSRAHTGR